MNARNKGLRKKARKHRAERRIATFELRRKFNPNARPYDASAGRTSIHERFHVIRIDAYPYGYWRRN